MFNSDKLVLRFNDSSFDAALLCSTIGKYKIKDIRNFKVTSDNDLTKFSSTENAEKLNAYLAEKKVRTRNVQVVMRIEGIITRLVETPMLKKLELNSFIENNRREYFTVNVEDYYFDYKVIKNRNEKKLQVILCAIPKSRIDDIYEFIEKLNLVCDKISVYPDCISRLFCEIKEKSAAVLDLNRGKSNITILNKGAIFLHSSFYSEGDLDNGQDYSTELENAEYFLNFYSTRNFGNGVEKLYIIGEGVEALISNGDLSAQFNAEVIYGFDGVNSKIALAKDSVTSLDADIMGCALVYREVYNKSINFVKVIKKNKEQSDLSVKKVAAGLIFATVLFFIFSILYPVYLSKRYNVEALKGQLKQLESIETQLVTMEQEAQTIQNKKAFLEEIEKERFDYSLYLEKFKKELPEGVTLNKITLAKDKINVAFNINNSMDKIKIAIFVNKMGLFQPVQLDNLALDDSESYFELELFTLGR